MSATASEARPSRTGTLLGEKLQDSDANPIKACISLFSSAEAAQYVDQDASGQIRVLVWRKLRVEEEN